ncbi:hypothetical protein C5S30_05240 [ANME-1 cluster archaeon GoMg4]|nr:hypothetical protein [ANME-1 cluster archaeon GoMg4]
MEKNNLLIVILSSKKWKKRDYLFYFLFIPSILIFIFFLPSGIKDLFTLKINDPTIISIFFSNYTHENLKHLIDNLFGYLFIIFLLFNIEVNKRFLNFISLLNFILLPIILSLLMIYYLPKNSPPVLGFSGIVSAFTGYLLYSTYAYIKHNYYSYLNHYFIVLLFMVNVIILSIYNPIMHILLIPSLILTIALLYLNIKPIKEIISKLILLPHQLIEQISIWIYKFTIFSLTFFFIFSLWIFLPYNIKIGSALINTLAHYSGYVFGVFVPMLIERLSGLFWIQSIP